MVDPILLQGLCSAGKSGPAYLTDFQFVKAVSCTYADPAGLLVVGMLVYGGVSLSIYSRTGDIRIPAVLLLLTGGAVTSQIAAPGLTIAGLIVLFVGMGVLTLLYYRYSR